MNDEQITNDIVDDTSTVDDSRIDDVLQRHDDLHKEVVEIKEFLQERFVEEEIEEIQVDEDILTTDEILAEIHKEESYQTIILLLILGSIIGYVFIKGLFDNWKSKPL